MPKEELSFRPYFARCFKLQARIILCFARMYLSLVWCSIQSVWNEQLDILRQRLNRWDKEQWQIFRQFVSDAEVISLDGNGRFLIPKRYLKFAGIEQELKFIGVDDTIEIWSKDNSETPFGNPQNFGSALQSLMELKEEK